MASWYTTLKAKHNVFKQGVHHMTSPFGMRTLNGRTSMHNGVDVIGNGWACDYIVAFADGKVTDVLNTCSGKTPATGNYVVIDHGNNVKSVYYHMAKGSVKVKAGQAVKAGDVLGYMGTTGDSTGNHLHFGININSEWVDPVPYLEGKKVLPVQKESSLEEDLKELAKAGIINTPDYWKNNASKLTYVPELIHNMAEYLRK